MSIGNGDHESPLAHEKKLELKEVPKVLEEDLERGSTPPCYETVRKWTVPPGFDGVVLETERRGRKKVTSRQAIARFFARLAQAKAAPERLPGSINMAAAMAAKEVLRNEFGIG